MVLAERPEQIASQSPQSASDDAQHVDSSHATHKSEERGSLTLKRRASGEVLVKDADPERTSDKPVSKKDSLAARPIKTDKAKKLRRTAANGKSGTEVSRGTLKKCLPSPSGPMSCGTARYIISRNQGFSCKHWKNVKLCRHRAWSMADSFPIELDPA